MLKEFSRWLFMKTHHRNLIEVKNYIETGMEPNNNKSSLYQIDWKASEGALEALVILDLLVRK